MSALKKIFYAGCLALALAGSAAWAGDSPKDVQAALQQRNYPLAEQELRQAIAEHPGSAKAHYILAQVLAHESNIGEAQKEANQAKQLDPAIGFTEPAKFEAFQRELAEALAPVHQRSSVAPVAMQQSSERPSERSSHISPLTWLIGGVIVVLLIGLFMRRNRQRNDDFGPGGYANNGFGNNPPPYPPGSYPPGSYPGNAGYPPGYPQGGSGAGKAFLGGLAGGALGAAAVEMYENHERNEGLGQAPWNNGNAPLPTEDPQTQAYDDLRSQPFDTGNDDNSWGGGDDSFGGGDDDSWN